MFEYTAKVAKTLRQDGPLALRKRDSNKGTQQENGP